MKDFTLHFRHDQNGSGGSAAASPVAINAADDVSELMTTPYRCILLFGMPGVGKGTQGQLLGQIPGIGHMATGDMFRSLDRQSELGRKFLEYSSQGLLVPDELTVELWRQYMQGKIHSHAYMPDRELLLLDGIPRSVQQVRQMSDKIAVLRIIHLMTDDIDAMVSRMKRRAEQQGRHDDADEQVIRRRFEVYHADTAPVLDEYDPAIITNIDAIGRPAEVLLRILRAVVPVYTENFPNPLG